MSIIRDHYHLKKHHQTVTRFTAYTFAGVSFVSLIVLNCSLPFKNQLNGLIRVSGTILCGLLSGYSIYKINELRLDDEENFVSREAYLDWYNQSLGQIVQATLPNNQTININQPASMPMIESTNQVSQQTQSSQVSIASNDKRKKELWERLNQPQYEVLIKLLEAKPLLICGPQGSGKTVFASYLGLLRKLFLNHTIEVNDPHAHLNDWPKTFDTYGSQLNYNAINQRLRAYYDRIKKPGQKVTSIWDELTNYQERCQKDLSEGFLKSLLSDTRKPPEYPIVIAHGETLTSLGGGKGGVKQMSDEGLIKVRLQTSRDTFGKPFPAMRGQIVGLYTADNGEALAIPLQLETWMQPGHLLDTFPELAQSNFVGAETVDMPMPDVWADDDEVDIKPDIKPTTNKPIVTKQTNTNYQIDFLKTWVMSQDEVTINQCLNMVVGLTDKAILYLFESWQDQKLGIVELNKSLVDSKFYPNDTATTTDMTTTMTTNNPQNLDNSPTDMTTTMTTTTTTTTICCPNCGSDRIIKGGFTPAGTPRLLCKDCGKKWVIS